MYAHGNILSDDKRDEILNKILSNGDITELVLLYKSLA